jgi:hypothetical protein
MINPQSTDPATLYRKLKEIAELLDDRVSKGELAQEILDFLAMTTGLKPVFLLGRGLDEPHWIAAVADLAREAGFHVLEGPFWDATPFERFPNWYRDYTQTQLGPFRATYICLSDETARGLATMQEARGRLSMTAEARLLGYPDCCVVAHYDRAVRYHQSVMLILKRLAGGDEARMQILLKGGAALAPQTQEEISFMGAAFDVKPAPYGSWNKCPYCAQSNNSPSANLSEKYKMLAVTTDPELLRTLLVD